MPSYHGLSTINGSIEHTTILPGEAAATCWGLAHVLEHGARARVLVQMNQISTPRALDVGEAHVGPVPALAELDLVHVSHAVLAVQPTSHTTVALEAKVVRATIATCVQSVQYKSVCDKSARTESATLLTSI